MKLNAKGEVDGIKTFSLQKVSTWCFIGWLSAYWVGLGRKHVGGGEQTREIKAVGGCGCWFGGRRRAELHAPVRPHLVWRSTAAILKFFTSFEREVLRFHFALGPANYAAGFHEGLQLYLELEEQRSASGRRPEWGSLSSHWLPTERA